MNAPATGTTCALVAALVCAGARADNLIRDLSDTPQAEVESICRSQDRFAWVACRELGHRAHYGKGVAQDLAAARRHYEQARAAGSMSGDSDLQKLGLDAGCAALGARVEEPGAHSEVEDCAGAYYEGKTTGDFKDAVACAQRARQAETLAMLYANGHGVSRDLDKAIRAACDYRDVSAERDGMLERLFAMKASGSTETFDFCDHVTSGYNIARCTRYGTEIEAAQDEAALAAARDRWTEGTQTEWARLEPLADGFGDAQAEVDAWEVRGGSLYVAEYLGRRATLRHAFMDMVVTADSFDPSKDAPELGRLDRELNALYGRWLQTLEDAEEKSAARTAGRAWIRYRDAMAAFFVSRLEGMWPPAAIRNGVLARLTRERVAHLRSALGEGPTTAGQ